MDHDGTVYRAGVNLLFGAHAYLASSPLVLAARGVLQDLAVSTGLAAAVFVRSRDHRVMIARVEGSNPLRYELPIGERLPLYLAAGKVLVARLPEPEQDALVARVCPFTTAGGREFTTEAYRAELAEILTRGFAVSESERVLGGRSVAAPVLDARGNAVAAIQVVGTTESLPEARTNQVAALTVAAAKALGTRL